MAWTNSSTTWTGGSSPEKSWDQNGMSEYVVATLGL